MHYVLDLCDPQTGESEIVGVFDNLQDAQKCGIDHVNSLDYDVLEYRDMSIDLWDRTELCDSWDLGRTSKTWVFASQ